MLADYPFRLSANALHCSAVTSSKMKSLSTVMVTGLSAVGFYPPQA